MPDVTLRPTVETDLEVFFVHQLDERAAAMAAFKPRDRESFYEHWRKILADSSLFARTITIDEEVVGNVVSWVQDGHQEIGYWIAPAFWGRGIATAAVELFVDEVRVRPLFAWVAEHNGGSIRVLEKCGFIRSDHKADPPPGEVRFVIMELSD